MALDMTCMGRMNIVKFGKCALSSYLKIDCRGNYSTAISSRPHKIEFFNGKRNTELGPSRGINDYGNIKFRLISNSSDNHDGSSSSFHQQCHRESYERKRSSYQKDSDKRNDTRHLSSNDQATHYQRLNIEPGADLKAIKSAYYTMSKLYHPDIVGTQDAEAAENFRLITESYDTLSDPRLRLQYDREIDSEYTPVTVDNLYRGMHSDKDFGPTYRARNVDALFRSKQEAALRREKILNPRKFQAGGFRQSQSPDDQASLQFELEKLERRMQALKTDRNKSRDSFYDTHLTDIMHRKRYDILLRDTYIRNSAGTSSSESLNQDTVDLLTAFSIISLILLVIINLFFNIDIGAYLDTRLEESSKREAD